MWTYSQWKKQQDRMMKLLSLLKKSKIGSSIQGGVSKSMLTLNEAIIDVKEG